MTTVAIPEPVLSSALVALRRLIDSETHDEVLALREDSAAAWRAAQVVLSQHRVGSGHTDVHGTLDIEQHHSR